MGGPYEDGIAWGYNRTLDRTINANLQGLFHAKWLASDDFASTSDFSEISSALLEKQRRGVTCGNGGRRRTGV